MKKILLLLPVILMLVYILTSSYTSGPASVGHLDGTGATTSSGCSCHSHATSTTVSIELDSAGVAVTHYMGGGSYTIKIKGTNTSSTTLSHFGFQLAAVKSSGAGTSSAVDGGTLASTGLPTSCQFTSTSTSFLPIDVVEQSSAIAATSGSGDSGTTYVESIGWTAPTTGTGSIKIYAAVNAVNNDGSSSGDKWNNNNVTITEAVTTAPITGTFTVCAGSSTALIDTYSSGTWSSSSPLVATVSTTGVVEGITDGTSVISYDEGSSGIATATVTVTALPVAGTITGSVTMCAGGSTTLSDGASGGIWSSSATGVATISSTGIVIGISGGTADISYTVTNACGSAAAGLAITVNPLPSAGSISGAGGICSTTPVTLTDGATGGTWSATNANATISTSGVVTGVASGFDTILYSVTNSCGTIAATKSIFISLPPSAGTITGTSPLCTGTSTLFTETATGGVWASSSTGIATVNSSGLVTGLTSGTDSITYTVTNFCGSASVAKSITVNISPSAGVIAGVAGVCTGSSISLTDSSSGGTWNSSNGNASVTSGGVVSGLLSGIDTIIYTVTNACGTATAIHIITISTVPDAGAITGASPLCTGTSTLFTETATGGVWASSSTGVATVNSSGVVTGLTSGTDSITYTVTNFCGSASVAKSITVNVSPSAGVIAGAAGVCTGSSISLTDSSSGGTWNSSNGNASVTSGGVVSGLLSGIDTIIYTVTNACGTATAIHIITISNVPDAGAITGASPLCTGTSTLFTETATGGVWASSSTGVATVNSSGLVTGLTSGADSITYTVTNFCGSASVAKSITVNVSPSAGVITGAAGVCTGSSISLTESSSGGTWNSSNGNASVTSGGVVSGLLSGIDTIIYTVTNACGTATAIHIITISTVPDAGAITGASPLCTGTSTLFTETATGGVWASSSTGVATVNSSGVVTGLTSGTDSITYTVTNFCGSASVAKSITVNVSPSAGVIAGAAGVCTGSSISLTESGSGGTWNSSNGNASVTPGGVVSGLLPGRDTITYTVTNTCGTATAIHIITISNTPDAGAITGPTTLCQGSTTSFTDAATGGVWSSGNIAVATINASGLVTATAEGTVTIFYRVTNSCGSALASKDVTVNPLPVAGVITGLSFLCAGTTITLTDTTAGGTWSSSDINASVTTSGVVTGITGGTATIMYSVTNSCGTASANHFITINNASTPAGMITGDTSLCVGNVIILHDSLAGGTWTASNSAAIIVSGVVVGVSPGYDTIYYSIASSCGSSVSAYIIDILPAGSCGAAGVSAVAIKEMEVYPNPSNGVFTISMPYSAGSGTVNIIDYTGKIMKSISVDNGVAKEIDLSDLPQGHYILSVQTENKIFRKKITIIK